MILRDHSPGNLPHPAFCTRQEYDAATSFAEELASRDRDLPAEIGAANRKLLLTVLAWCRMARDEGIGA